MQNNIRNVTAEKLVEVLSLKTGQFDIESVRLMSRFRWLGPTIKGFTQQKELDITRVIKISISVALCVEDDLADIANEQALSEKIEAEIMNIEATAQWVRFIRQDRCLKIMMHVLTNVEPREIHECCWILAASMLHIISITKELHESVNQKSVGAGSAVGGVPSGNTLPAVE